MAHNKYPIAKPVLDRSMASKYGLPYKPGLPYPESHKNFTWIIRIFNSSEFGQKNSFEGPFKTFDLAFNILFDRRTQNKQR